MSFKTLIENVVATTINTFGEDVTYTPTVGSPVSIKGIFDNSFIDVDGIVSLKPTLRINLADLDLAPAKGDTLSVNSTSYRVLESQADSYGGSTLILQKV